MIYYVSEKAFRSGDGTKERPFKKISEAAKIAKPGDEVIVSPGVYREYVDPANAGTPDSRITYRSEVKGGAVITGAEMLTGWEHYEGNTYVAHIGNGLFGDYNPYTTVVKGDWYFAELPVHTGEVYVDGVQLYEVMKKEEVLNPEPAPMSWEPREVSIRKWYTEQDGDTTLIYVNIGDDPAKHNMEFNVRRNCFMPSREGIGYITVSGFTIKQAATTWAPPTAYQDGMVGPHWSKGWIIEDCEISDSRCSGISLGKYLQPEDENKWTRFGLKDGTQTQRDCVMQAINEGWSKETVGSHIIRRCHIHQCGQTGIVGHMGGVFSIIEDNHIHNINNKQDLAGAEIGGIKMHAAIDVIFRRNHIHHCTRGMWLDWQAQGTRVSQNLFHDNTPPKGIRITSLLGLGEDIWVEVSHGPTLLDNNLFLSPLSMRISAQGIACVHNLIGGAITYVDAGVENGGAYLPTPRYTPYHVPHETDVAGFMTFNHGDMRFYNNIFVQQNILQDYKDYVKEIKEEKEYNFVCGLSVYDGYPTTEEYLKNFGPWKFSDEGAKDKYYEHFPVDASGNLYFNGAKSGDMEKDAYVDDIHKVELSLGGSPEEPVLVTNLYDILPDRPEKTISTKTLGQAFEPEMRFENPDGSEIVFNEDYFGDHREVCPIAGPFAHTSQIKKQLFQKQ